MQKIDTRFYLASGKTVETTLEVPDDFDEREVEQLIADTLSADSRRGGWQQLGDLIFHSAAVQAVELI